MKKKAYIMLLSSLLLFGSNGIIASNIALTSYEIVFFRTLIGSLMMMLLFFLSGRRFHLKGQGRDILFVALSGVSMGASWMFLYEGFKQLGVSIASLLYYCGPVIVMALSPLLFKEKLTAIKLMGFGAVLAGIVLLNFEQLPGGLNRWGVFCAMMAAVAYAALVIFNKLSKNLTGMENTTVQLIFSFITVAVFLGFKQGFAIHVAAEDWVWILIIGVVNSGFGCFLYFSAISLLPVQSVAVCGYLEPVTALILSALILHERMSPWQTAGAVLIIGGAMAAELLGSRKTNKKIAEP